MSIGKNSQRHLVFKKFEKLKNLSSSINVKRFELVHGVNERLLGLLMQAGVPSGRVLWAVLDGRVPDHDALVVVLDDGLGQPRDGLSTGGPLGSKKDRVLGNAHFNGET